MIRVCAAPTWQYTNQAEEGEEERSSAATSVTLVEGGDDVYPDTYGPWRVCCRGLERIGDPDDDGLDEHGGICSLGFVFERCWTCEGVCHFHAALNGRECRGLPCHVCKAASQGDAHNELVATAML